MEDELLLEAAGRAAAAEELDIAGGLTSGAVHVGYAVGPSLPVGPVGAQVVALPRLYGALGITLATGALLPATVTVIVLDAVTVAGGSPQGTTELDGTTSAAATSDTGRDISLSGSGLT